MKARKKLPRRQQRMKAEAKKETEQAAKPKMLGQNKNLLKQLPQRQRRPKAKEEAEQVAEPKLLPKRKIIRNSCSGSGSGGRKPRHRRKPRTGGRAEAAANTKIF